MRDKNACQWESDGLENPLVYPHVVNVLGIHTQNASNNARGRKDDGHDSKGVDGRLLTVFVGIGCSNILLHFSLESSTQPVKSRGIRYARG